MPTKHTIGRLASLLFIAALQYGCASAAKQENMVYDGPSKAYDAALVEDVGIESVEGGRGTNPLWTSQIDDDAFEAALRSSLEREGLLADEARFALVAELIELDQPFLGFDFEVTVVVRYRLTDTTTSELVFDETLSTPYTATVGDAFVGVRRMRLANEGAARANIAALLARLSTIDATPRLSMLAR